MNPLAGIPYEFHFHALHDYDETTNAGAMCVIICAHINMGMLEEVEENSKKIYDFMGLDKFRFVNSDQLTKVRLGGTRKHVM